MLLLIAARSTALPSTRQPINRARTLASAAWVGDAYAAELAAAVGAVAEACGVAKALQRRGVDGFSKSDASPVTVADLAVQAVVIRRLHDAFPGDAFIAEESATAMLAFEGGRAALEDAADACGLSVAALTEHVDRGRAPRAGAARTWVLDPVDGTKGFLRGAQFCCALALVDGVPGADVRDATLGVLGCPNLAATCELPAGDPMDAAGVVVAAARGRGAHFAPLADVARWTRARSSGSAFAAGRLVEGVALSHSDHDASARAAADLGISRPPLRLDSQAKAALLANGQAELFTRLPTAGYVEKVWDFAAAKVVITEAGGAISDLDGDDIDVDLGECLSPKVAGIVATSSPALQPAALAAVARARAA